MKSFYTVALGLTLLFGATVYYYFEECIQARNATYPDRYPGEFSYETQDHYYELMNALTREAGYVSEGFIAFYLILYSASLVLLQRRTGKAISILGIFLSLSTGLGTFLPISNPTHISFDEFGILLFIYMAIMLVFCAVNLGLILKTKSGIRFHNETTLDDFE